jgi:hypothetical protein
MYFHRLRPISVADKLSLAESAPERDDSPGPDRSAIVAALPSDSTGINGWQFTPAA